MTLRSDCDYIVAEAIRGVLPDTAVRKALKHRDFGPGRIIMVAIGKAAFSMAKAAKEALGTRIETGVVITKYGHAKGELEGITIFEAGHPVPDNNTLKATQEALAITRGLKKKDTILFLISGGGSSLFESPLISLEELKNITEQFLACGANIVEMNTIRKRLSNVKGGRFAEHCRPAKLFSIILSDIVGDPLDMIASGPAHADQSTCAEAYAIIEKYGLSFPDHIMDLLKRETPKIIHNAETVVTGSVRELCSSAAKAAEKCGYALVVLTDSLTIQAREAGSFLAAIGRYNNEISKPMAFIIGGETVVNIIGDGKGGRNQELALSAAEGIRGLKDMAIFSVGSDGTDGPTDAAGGFVDGNTANELEQLGISIHKTLQNNDAYHALRACNGLIFTGATGTNVNDVAVLLVKR
jgi:glycerate 2-kinase